MPPHIGDGLSEPSFGVRGMQEQYLPESVGRCALRIRLHCSWSCMTLAHAGRKRHLPAFVWSRRCASICWSLETGGQLGRVCLYHVAPVEEDAR